MLVHIHPDQIDEIIINELEASLKASNHYLKILNKKDNLEEFQIQDKAYNLKLIKALKVVLSHYRPSSATDQLVPRISTRRDY